MTGQVYSLSLRGMLGAFELPLDALDLLGSAWRFAKVPAPTEEVLARVLKKASQTLEGLGLA